MSLENDLRVFRASVKDMRDRITSIEKGTTETRPAPRFLSSQAWPWYSLRPYLCGGWVDAFSDSPYRYDAITAGVNPHDQAGFFDTGQALLFTGGIYWDPESWWAAPLYNSAAVANPLLQGHPEVYKDASQIIGLCDGLGNGVGSTFANDDLGYPLPYVPAERGSSSMILHTGSSYHFGTAERWTDGAHLDITPTYRTSGPNGIIWSFNSIVGGSGYGVVDPNGFTHHGAPAGSCFFNLDGCILRYTAALPVPTGYPTNPRTQDAFFGVSYA